ncbi:hypothetical protein [Ralstonia flatus]|uniref:hypothetical protein n=1 Tax=Ralstonia flatus TaxID=3058601 RepID=UPI001DEB3BD6|nr:hypothetical protein [Ralstonia sp. LMG 32965]MBN6209144.1 hypothetical protein [Ralstonia pickettii]
MGRLLWCLGDRGLKTGCLALIALIALVVHPLFHPLPGLTYFLCLAKESKQRKARPMRRLPLEFP